MHRSTRFFLLLLVAALAIGCSSSDDDDADESATGDPAIDDAGTATPPPPGDGDPQATPDPVISGDTAERLVEEALEIYSGQAWDTFPLSLPEALQAVDGLFEPADGLTELPDGSFALVLVANCRTGSARLEAEIPNTTGNHSWEARIDACAPDPASSDLELVSGSVEGVWNWHTSARSDELVWNYTSGRQVRFDGEMRRRPDEFQRDNIAAFVTTNANQTVGIDGEAVFAIEAATSTRRIGSTVSADVAALSGGFTYRSANTGGRSVSVRIPVELTYQWDWRSEPAPLGVAPEDLGALPLGNAQVGPGRTDEQWAAVERVRRRWAFTTGMLVLVAEDGSSLMLDAGTGALDTVRMTLDEGRGEGVEESVMDWPGSWYRALAPDTLPSERAEASDTAR